eukprot:2853586-Prymnesium_polylepis.1
MATHDGGTRWRHTMAAHEAWAITHLERSQSRPSAHAPSGGYAATPRATSRRTARAHPRRRACRAGHL